MGPGGCPALAMSEAPTWIWFTQGRHQGMMEPRVSASSTKEELLSPLELTFKVKAFGGEYIFSHLEPFSKAGGQLPRTHVCPYAPNKGRAL